MNSVIRFFRKVYEQELSQSKRLHLHSSRIHKRYFLSGVEELLTGEYPVIPISDSKGEEIFKILELKGSEMELKYYSMIRISKFTSLNKYETVRAYPLFEFKARISTSENGYFLTVDLNSKSAIKSNLPASVISDPEFKKINLAPVLDLHFVSRLQLILNRHIDNVRTDNLIMFPMLTGNKRINELLKGEFEESEVFLSAGILCLVEKENESYTTLDELKSLENETEFSAPLRALFDSETNYNEEKPGIICEELNRSQMRAVSNSNERVFSIISGPPGTGKSFTIANLAAEKVSKGQSVLITSKNQEALEVIEEKITQQLDIENLCINPSRDSQFLALKKYLDFLLGWEYNPVNQTMEDIEKMFSQFQEIHDNHISFESELIKNLELEKRYISEYLNKGFGEKNSENFKKRVLKSRGAITIPLWDKLQLYYNGIDASRTFSRGLIRAINRYMIDTAISNNRKELRNYLSFLRARETAGKKNKEEAVDFNTVLRTFPVWLVKANEISKGVAFDKELFDVLIIDEASQCDVPTLLPLLQRAKKCIVVGDLNQLKHISFVPKVFENNLRKDVNEEKRAFCRHRDCSILDLAGEIIDPQAVTQLNEHFRSQFPIISFSNKEFYDNSLHILTKRPLSSNKHVQFIHTNGHRIKGINQTEIDVILESINQTIIDESELAPDLKSSIGILSPFRLQVEQLFQEIKDRFTIKEIKDHKILVGTAFSFQGNERDIMHLSFCLDDKSLGGSFTFLNRNDVFNVSVTRARNTQYIYHSFSAKSLNHDSTVANFFRHYELDLKNETEAESKNEFCLEIEQRLKKYDFKCWKNFELSGVKIDLLLLRESQYIGIDLIGFPGEMEDYYSLERYKMMERGKVKIFPLSCALWLADSEKCIQNICGLIVSGK